MATKQTQTDPRPEAPMLEQEPVNHPMTRANGNLPGVMEMTTAPITAIPVQVPRDEAKVLNKLRTRAAMAGDDWYYRFPVKDKGATKYIEGPSIKCANNVAQLFGNCAIRTRAIDNFDSWIIYARLEDYEQGFVYERPWLQPKGQQTLSTRDQGRAEAIAFQIGVSKAIRNVVCNALELFTTFAFEEARNSMVERIGKALPATIEKIKARLGEMSVDVKRIEALVGRPVASWLAPDCARVIAEITAISEGMASIDETWPDAATAAATKPKREDFEKKPEPKAAAAKPAAVVEGKMTITNPTEGIVLNKEPEPTGEVFEIFNEEGDLIDTFTTEKVWAVKLIAMCDAEAARRPGLLSANEHMIGLILDGLEKAGEGQIATDLRAHLAHDKEAADAPPAQQAPEPPKAIVMPKRADNAIDVAAYVALVKEAVTAASDEAAVRSIISVERAANWKKPDGTDRIKSGPQSAMKVHAHQRLAYFGVTETPKWD